MIWTNKSKAHSNPARWDPKRATSGSNLLKLIVNKTPLITTIINKFETALDTARKQGIGSDRDENLFVLVDESHRTQTGSKGGFGQFALKMRRLLPQACYLGFTGTPLLKRDRNTLRTFGGLIHHYKIDQAVADESCRSSALRRPPCRPASLRQCHRCLV